MSPNAETLRRKESVCSRIGEAIDRARLPKDPEAEGLRGRISRASVDGCAIRFNGRGGALEAMNRFVMSIS